MDNQPHNSQDTENDGLPHQSTMHITHAELRTMLEATAARAASEALTRFLESQQNDKAEKIADENGLSTVNPKDDAQKKTTNEAKTPPLNSKKNTTHREDEAQSQAQSTTMNDEEKSLNMKEDHLDKFYAKANLYDISDAAYCKIFRTTLSGRALSWFNKLASGTIENLEQLTQRFLHQFSINKKYPKTAAYLFTIIQKEEEVLRDYVQRFTQAVHEVPHVNNDLLAGIIQQNLRHRNFKESIAGKPPTSLEELLERAKKYIHIEESIEHDTWGREEGRKRNQKIREKMIGECLKPTTPVHPLECTSDKPGGPACGDTNHAWKNLARATRGDHPYSRPVFTQIVHEISRPSEEVSFGNVDLETSRDEHNDALIISAIIFNFWVKKILVDSGSSAEIIFTGNFRISNTQLMQVKTPLIDFAGETVEAAGKLTLPLYLRSYPRRTTKMVKCLVVKAPSPYNVILGRPSLNLFQAISSTYHMKLKFQISDGIGDAIGDSRLARMPCIYHKELYGKS
ncbi:uncharacterized protein [Henckelia pumila]|uniref:uncharacterized protein n=1 Tax=Henckelia pumila TaxID=405737 RepID=UPI003C6E1C28